MQMDMQLAVEAEDESAPISPPKPNLVSKKKRERPEKKVKQKGIEDETEGVAVPEDQKRTSPKKKSQEVTKEIANESPNLFVQRSEASNNSPALEAEEEKLHSQKKKKKSSKRKKVDADTMQTANPEVPQALSADQSTSERLNEKSSKKKRLGKENKAIKEASEFKEV